MRLLFVCTGDICRSPLAVFVLRARLEPAAWLRLESAGTQAAVGRPMTVEAAWLAREHGATGLAPTDHVSRPVTTSLVESADLVLTMTKDQRRDVVGLVPRALRRAFTVRQFAALAEALDAGQRSAVAAEQTPAARWDQFVRAVGQVRLMTAPPREEDVLDPYGKSDGAYRQCAAQLMPALGVVEGALRLVGDVAVPADGPAAS